MEFGFAQSEVIVKRAVSGSEGEPDWGTILELVQIIELAPDAASTLAETLCRQLKSYRHSSRMNSLILIDALFKNSKPPQLKSLQNPNLVRFLSDPLIDYDPALHNFLYNTVPTWRSTLEEHRLLNAKFGDFLDTFKTSRYVPNLTAPIREKMFTDLSGAAEVLELFTDCLVSGSSEPETASILEEMTSNIREIVQRLTELLPTIVDSNFQNIIRTIQAFCSVCLGANEAWREGRSVEAEALQTMRIRTRAVLEAHGGKPKEKRKAPRKSSRLGDDDDLPDEEFFAELAKLKVKREPDPLLLL
jgi:hypothetical protein